MSAPPNAAPEEKSGEPTDAVPQGSIPGATAGSPAPRAWLVDLDGTLYYPKPLKVLMGAELLLLGLPKLSLIQAFRSEHERLREDPDPPEGEPYQVQLERTAQRVGSSVEKIAPVLRSWMVERPCKWLSLWKRRSILEEIRTFHSQGGATALVSDYPARRKLAALGASPLFDVVVANGEPGGPRRLKPDPDGYLRAARELGVDPSECLVIGDRDDADGAAARAAGMLFRKIGSRTGSKATEGAGSVS